MLERGWPGRIDGDTVVQLAAQTLQAFFTGGGDGARARRVPARRRRLPRAGAAPAVGADLRRRRRLRASRTRPRSARPDDDDPAPCRRSAIVRSSGVAAIIGADGAIGGFTPLVEWVAPRAARARRRATSRSRSGRSSTTPDEETPPGVDWERLVAHAAREHAPLSRRPDRRVKVAVVGAGVMGCATAWALRERGADVDGARAVRARPRPRVEPRPHAHLPASRIPTPYWVRLRAGGVRRLARARARSGCSASTGSSSSSRDPALTSARALDECGVAYRLLDADEVRALGAMLPDGWTALYVADAGDRASPTARGTRSSTAPACGRDERRIESTRRRSTRTSSSSPPARGSADSSPTCR